MTIDKAIEEERYKAKNANKVLKNLKDIDKYIERCNQIADWLEELKEYRKGFIEARQKDYETAYVKGFNDGCAKFSVGQDYEAGYNKAVDDCKEVCNQNWLNGTVANRIVKELATRMEQLKDGEK